MEAINVVVKKGPEMIVQWPTASIVPFISDQPLSMIYGGKNVKTFLLMLFTIF